ncbi:MAG: COX15/CtaA family protein [Acidobacteriia bacterium]|nr:COX15/CtaA family protein [Terriglobia bacterium]
MNRTSSNPWLHRYATLVAFCTFLLIIAGALVTSNDAGLSVPDWPTSFGSFRMPRMVGGILYEHGHRMIAGTVAILTVLLAVWLWLKESRRWVRWLGIGTVLAVLAQATLGGITVLFYLPPAVSSAHATLGQIFFCINVSLALFTSPRWRWDEPKAEDPSTPSLRALTILTTGAILVQLILGALYRHSAFGITPHLIGALVVGVLVLYVGARVLMRFSKRRGLLHAALLLMGLLIAQVSLGIASYVVKMADLHAPQPLPPVVDLTTAHVAVGALMLVSSLYLTYQAHRFLAPADDLDIASAPHGATV